MLLFTKTGSLLSAIACGVIGVAALATNGGWYALLAFLVMVGFAATFFSKYARDRKLVAHGRAARAALDALASREPLRMSPGSRGVFVPDRHPEDHAD
ncbi:MAG TPA: hypothetical protein VH393_04355 [Ktedonobacterales bacterium]|jgi:hypothetical protein